MSTMSKRALLSAITAAGALSGIAAGSLPAGAAGQGPKPVPPAPTRIDRSILATEAGARTTSPANARAAQAVVQRRIAAYVAEHGTKYSFASYVDARTGALVVQSDAPARVVATLTDVSGERSAAGARIATSHTTTSDHFNRRDDSPPFYGGGGITAAGGVCSSGYTVTWSSYRYMVTAGHCWANGTAVKTESQRYSYGTVTGRALASLGGGPRDMELIYGGSYSARIFTGGVLSTSSAAVVGAGDAVQGYTNYCHSGRTTGENCGHTAVDVNAQVCTQSGCKSPVVAFTGGVMTQGGDSGSPFYVKSSTQAWIRGHVIAGNGSTSYAEKWGKVAARYGVSIATS